MCDAGYVETLDECGACVAFLEDVHMDNLGLLLFGLAALGLAHENLFGHAHHLVGAVAIEEDDIVNVRAVADKFVLLQTGADEAFLFACNGRQRRLF